VLRERFDRPLDEAALALSESTREDARLLAADLWGSRAHARMLGEVGLLPLAAARRIDRGLKAIERRAAAGRFPLDPRLEDVHMNVEAALTRAIGPDGERLHTGRSRNDQVATDLAVYLREALLDLEARLARLAEALRRKAAGPEGRVIVPGWTHLQPAQRVYVGQLLGTHALRFLRDAERLRAIRARIQDSPLGSGALAGSSLPLDRRRTAALLGFARPGPSSLDAVSDRDAAVETLAALALFAVHASGLAEELVLGAMPELGRVRLGDAFVTTSSLMPHKRNPDLAELVRGESGPAIGRLTGALALLKGLPLAYNRDLQVGKPILFEGVQRAALVLEVLPGMVATATFGAGTLASDHPVAATGSVELVDALVARGVPFRAAHARVAAFLRDLDRTGVALSSVRPAAWRAAFPELGSAGAPDLTGHPDRRTTEGGSSRAALGALLREVARRGRAAARDVARERARLAALRAELDRPLRRRAKRS
jgi:argininosuccinate lyase